MSNQQSNQVFLMRGRDADCRIIVYRTWKVVGEPDPTGNQYNGYKFGNSPLLDIVIVAQWSEGDV